MRPVEAVVSLLRQLAEQLSSRIVHTVLAGSDPALGLHTKAALTYVLTCQRRILTGPPLTVQPCGYSFGLNRPRRGLQTRLLKTKLNSLRITALFQQIDCDTAKGGKKTRSILFHPTWSAMLSTPISQTQPGRSSFMRNKLRGILCALLCPLLRLHP